MGCNGGVATQKKVFTIIIIIVIIMIIMNVLSVSSYVRSLLTFLFCRILWGQFCGKPICFLLDMNKLVWLKSKRVNNLGFVLLVMFADSTMGSITIFHHHVWIHVGNMLELVSNHPPGKSKCLKGMSGLRTSHDQICCPKVQHH